MATRKGSREIHGHFRQIAPRIVRWLDGGRIYPVEGLMQRSMCGVPEHHDALHACHILDAAGHIDYMHESDDGVLRGLAARVQICRPTWNSGRPWDTFTLRTRGTRAIDVELEHLRRALGNPDEGVIRPAYQIQAYILDNRVESIGMVRIVDLVRYATVAPIGAHQPVAQPAANGRNNFTAVSWDDLEAAGVKVRIWRRGEP